MRVAAIDIGTVTSRLFIADVDAAGVHPVVRQSVITNVGEGVDATGELAPAAIERTVAQVAQYRACIDECAADAPVDRMIALATSASRDAKNSDVFVRRLRDVGVELSVIPGYREAEAFLLGRFERFSRGRLALRRYRRRFNGTCVRSCRCGIGRVGAGFDHAGCAFV